MANPVQIVGTVAGAVLSKRSADKQEKAIRAQSDRDIALRKQMYEEDIARQQPYFGAGELGINQLSQLYGPGGMYTKTPTMEDLLIDPGYSFRLSEGEKAMARMQSARGQLLGGGAIKAGQRYGQGLASQEFQNAFDRLMNQRATVSNALLNLGQFGQNAVNMAGAAGRGYSSGAAQAFSNIGQAQADRAGQVGDIYQNVLGDVLKGYGQMRGPSTSPSRASSYGGSSVPYRSAQYGYYEGP
jgi:hypothetical protein